MDSFYTSHRPSLDPLLGRGIRSTGPYIIRRTYHPLTATHSSAVRTLWFIIGLNVASFLTWQYAIVKKDRRITQWLLDNTLVSQAAIDAGRWWTIVTSAFSHHDLTHFVFNMVSLNTFCSLLSIVPGLHGGHIVALTFGSAVSGSVYWLFHERQKAQKPAVKSAWGSYAQPGRTLTGSAALGASGVVMGCAAAATCLMPKAQMNLMFIPIRIPLWLITVAYAGLDLFYLNAQDSRVAHAGHIGGTLFGLFYYAAYLRGFGGVWPAVRRAIGGKR